MVNIKIFRLILCSEEIIRINVIIAYTQDEDRLYFSIFITFPI
jgi:hypothetical protein